MNATRVKVPTRFGPETRFEVTPSPPVPFRALHETELERLKARLLRARLEMTDDPELYAPLRRAANEAAALAWATPVPLLVFPELFEELARAAIRQVERQKHIRERSRALLRAA